MNIASYFKAPATSMNVNEVGEVEVDGTTSNEQTAGTSATKRKRANNNQDGLAEGIIDDAEFITAKRKTTAAERKKLEKEQLTSLTQNTLETKKLEEDQPTSLTYNTLETSLPSAWKIALQAEFTKPYFVQLKKSLQTRADGGEVIYPPIEKIFNAFHYVPSLDQIKVVLIGQDPYFNKGEAEGLCFSVPKGIKVPSSLQNIYKEIKDDIPGFVIPKHGHLAHWAEQGVLMLNAGLTVRALEANSHKSLGWSHFTDAVIQLISKQCNGVVFICWGSFAQKKVSKVDKNRHSILNGVHPSGLSAHRGFFGCKHFSKCNELLTKAGKTPIDWKIDQVYS